MNAQNPNRANSDLEFAYKVRHALNENLEQLPRSTTDRLALARQHALTRKKSSAPLLAPSFVSRLAGSMGTLGERAPWLGKMGLALPALVLMAGLIGIYHYEEQRRVNETADIDALVLSDELPLSAYLDHGFSTFLNKRGEQG